MRGVWEWGQGGQETHSSSRVLAALSASSAPLARSWRRLLRAESAGLADCRGDTITCTNSQERHEETLTKAPDRDLVNLLTM